MRAREFDSLEFQAVAWLINKHLNPRGYHFSILNVPDGEPRWFIQGDGTCAAVASEDEDLMFRLTKELLEEASEIHGGTNESD